MSAVILPLVIPGTYRKARGSASDGQKMSDTFDDRVTVLYLLPNGHFAFFAYRRGYERTLAAGQWVRSGERLVLHGLADHRSDCTVANFDKRSFTRHFLVEPGAAGPTLVDESPPPRNVLGWAGPFTFLGSRQCVTCVEWELSVYLGWPEQWEQISPWVTAVLAGTTVTPCMQAGITDRVWDLRELAA